MDNFCYFVGLLQALIHCLLSLHFCPEIRYELCPLVYSMHLWRSRCNGFPHLICLTRSLINILVPCHGGLSSKSSCPAMSDLSSTTSYLAAVLASWSSFFKSGKHFCSFTMAPEAFWPSPAFFGASLVAKQCCFSLLLDDLGPVKTVELELQYLCGGKKSLQIQARHEWMKVKKWKITEFLYRVGVVEFWVYFGNAKVNHFILTQTRSTLLLFYADILKLQSLAMKMPCQHVIKYININILKYEHVIYMFI